MAGTNRILIAVPSTQTWEAEFGMSLVFLTNYLAAHPEINGKMTQFRVHNKRGSILAHMRQSFIDTAIEHDCTHVLFLDSDQTFPHDILHQLMGHKKQVVACNIATKGFPSNPTARKQSQEHFGKLVYTTDDTTGLEEVWRIGTGVMLIDLNLFKREGMQERPWFSQHWNEKTQAYVGEDWAFCERLEAAGVKIYIDHDASKQVGHIGNLIYGMDTVTYSPEKVSDSVA